MQLKKTSPWIILALFTLLLLIIGCFNHYSFRTFALDYASYSYAFYDYAHFRITNNPVYSGMYLESTFFQDHFSLTFMILVPLYWILSWFFGSYTIIMVQTIFISWGARATYRLVLEKKQQLFPAVIALILYFVIYGRYSAFATDVNLMIILSSFVPVFLLYFQRGNFITSSICFLFLILGRESIALWTFFIALMLFLVNRKNPNKRKWALIYMVGSILYFVLVMKVFIPWVENPDKPFGLFEYAVLGETPIESLKHILAHPIESITSLFSNFSGDPFYDGVKQEFFFVYAFSGGILLLYRPYYLIAFIPIICQKMWNDYPSRWGISAYYGIETTTMLAVFLGLVLTEIRVKRLQWILGTALVIAASSMTIHTLKPENRIVFWDGTGKINFLDKNHWENDIEVSRIHKIISQIPAEASVCADTWLSPHLAQRDTISYFPRLLGNETYVTFFKERHFYMLSDEEYTEIKQSYLTNDEFEIVNQNKDIVLLKRKD